jgi:soluble lytic murein transglycosylase-like protein
MGVMETVMRKKRVRTAAHALPVLAALASLGFEHAEPGILHAPPVTSGVSRATLGELGLRTAGLQRTATIRQYADRYDIGWELSEQIYSAASDAGIDVGLAYRLVRVESSFKHGAVGPAGSIGLSQVQPQTARWMDPSVTREDLFDMETNLRLGFGYLRILIDRYRSTRLALLAYNRGPGTVQEVLAAGEDPANGYAARVLGGRLK